MAFVGPLACPKCRIETSVKGRLSWRLEGEDGLYKCPNGHVFLGRDFLDLGTLDHARYVMKRDRRAALEKLEGLLAVGKRDEFEQYLQEAYAMNDDRKQSLVETLKCVYAEDSDDYRNAKSEIEAVPNQAGMKRLLEEIDQDPAQIKRSFPHLWQLYSNRPEGGRLTIHPPEHTSHDLDRYTQIINKSWRRQLVGLCFLAEQMEAVVEWFRPLCEMEHWTIQIVDSAAEALFALSPNTHVIVDITAGKRWLPSKLLLEAKWGEWLGHLDGYVLVLFGDEPPGEVTVTTFQVPSETHLHFYADGPFNPPTYFAGRVSVEDLRRARSPRQNPTGLDLR